MEQIEYHFHDEIDDDSDVEMQPLNTESFEALSEEAQEARIEEWQLVRFLLQNRF